MRVVRPSTTFRGEGVRLAPRPKSLRGAVVGFLELQDVWLAED